MNKTALAIIAIISVGNTMAGLYGDAPDAKHAWAVHDMNRPKPVKVTPADLPGNPPSDAVVLFDGSRESFEKNWQDNDGNPSKWSYSDEGYFYTVPDWKNGGVIRTRERFGDCQLHIEYRHDPKQLYTQWGAQMRGNSGVFLMGNYEIQVLESYYTSADRKGKEDFVDNYADGQAGAVYAENPPLVNPARKPGEWQCYDIVFHQPVWKEDRLLHPGSVTVFFNGVLVQDHWEMEGTSTHCRRTTLSPHATKESLCLQDHGCVVQYRNIWYRPLSSRWGNLTHGKMSADVDEVMKLRRHTAESLFSKIADPSEVTVANITALAEVVSYANEGKYADAFRDSLEHFRKIDKKSKDDVEKVNAALEVLRRCNVMDEEPVL